MLIALVFLGGLSLKLAEGSNNGACNCIPKDEIVKKADFMQILQAGIKANNQMMEYELEKLLDDRIKTYLKSNYVSKKERKPNLKAIQTAQNADELDDAENATKEIKRELGRKFEELKNLAREMELDFLQTKIHYKKEITAEERQRMKLENSVHDVLEFACSSISSLEGSVRQSTIWQVHPIMCSQKYEFLKLSTPVTYSELTDLKVTCPDQDSCKKNRKSDSLLQYNCQCGPACSDLGTCCFDSPFMGQARTGPPQTCRKVYSNYDLAYFMVDACAVNGRTGEQWRELCARGNTTDFMTYVPVTSSATNRTYRNFYCLACHEVTEDYRFWEVQVLSLEEISTLADGRPLLVFDPAQDDWTGRDASNNSDAMAFLVIRKPPDVAAVQCTEGVVSKCRDDWQGDDVRKKCSAYTGILTLSRGRDRPYRLYRNAHCALCNFKSLSRAVCRPKEVDDTERDWTFVSGKSNETEIFKFVFSFTRFFDTLASSTDQLDCPVDSVWNPFSNECSTLTCSEGYSLRNRTCVPD